MFHNWDNYIPELNQLRLSQQLNCKACIIMFVLFSAFHDLQAFHTKQIEVRVTEFVLFQV